MPTKPSKTIRKSTKARKSAKNQPVTFREALAAGWPTTTSLSAPRLSLRQQRAGLFAAWAVAMVLAGTAIGLRLLANQPVAAQYPPAPIATASVKVSTLAPVGNFAQGTSQYAPNLTVTPASSVEQAQAGSPFAVLSATTYQSPITAGALTPGFTNDGRVQGNLGTASVE